MRTTNKTSVGKPSVIKRINMSQILDVIRKKGPISRSEIAEITNLTPATITNITSELINAKLIVEGEAGESSGGRKPIMLRIRCDYYRVIGVYIGSRKLKIMASDLMANSKYSKQIAYEKEQVTYQEILQILDDEIKIIKSKYQNKGKKIVGIGVGINGVVDTQEGTLIFAPNLGWRNVNIKQDFEQKFNIPVFVDNNTRTMALGESWFGTGKNIKNFFCINIDYGVGGSLFIDEKVYRGTSFGAGEIGHTTVDVNGEICSCGNRGCLETVASVKALRKKVYEGYLSNVNSSIFEGEEIQSVDDIRSSQIFEAANNGDQFAISLIKETGEKIGIGIANIINTFNPEMVVINGEIISTGEILLEPIVTTVMKRGFRSSVNATRIVLSKLGNMAYLKGAIVLATQHIFDDPESII
ncbi:MAG: ROK family transcriptional regulator [Clostridiales bacterium]|nr:ROK family transcriptional regulator [Clostridiales bacterium]